ncbi:glycosyl hydrolase family 28-related protein [Aurantiacibacter sp. MUD61]|uniref:glycosyl hydrolase family 28-related protein n=1 Tax=Aurantiacibacter sp. MUD61 TaxID=3009083 RepID=UPI0022F0C8E0|nr:glycosyl hydrolase family 28-related protein [Aurantiacibacter sp. MUD61]
MATDLPDILTQGADAPYLPDFSYAGYGYGAEPIPHIETVIDVADHGAVADDDLDDSAALIAAIAAASDHSGPVRVQLGAGRYILSEILWIERSGVVLAGMGSGEGGTELYMPRPLNQIDDGGTLDELREYLVRYDKRERQPQNNLDVLFSEYSWSGGFVWTRYPGGRHATYLEEYDRPIDEVTDIASGARGALQLRVADTSDLSVGDVLQIHWHNRAGEDGPLIAELYGEDRDGFPVGDRHWMLPNRPLVRQATRIEAINNGIVTIADPLLHDISDELPAYFARWDHISEVGIQDLAFQFPVNPEFGHHNEAGYNAVYFTGVYNGWIDNVRIDYSDAGILTDDLANVTISNVTTTGDHTAHYSVHLGNVHNVLVTDNEVFNPTVHTFSFNTQATRSVYQRSTGWTQPTLDQHAGANHQNLYDQIRVHVRPNGETDGGTPSYNLFRAGGAGYWRPGHGRYNTLWNVAIHVEAGVPSDGTIALYGSGEGPDANVIAMHGNRAIDLQYDPAPYIEDMGMRQAAVPSLYDYQLRARLSE